MKNQLIETAILEITNPTFETTKQFLEVHNVERENGIPKVERVDFESYQDVNIVYFIVQEEPFFLTFNFEKYTNKLLGVGTENGSQVYFTATSQNLTFEQLSELTNLEGLFGWSVNEDRKVGKSKYSFSRLSFEPIKSRAYDLDIKLKLLLTDLEKNLDGIKKLIAVADVGISLHHQMYISGNKAINFDKETLKRLSALNLGIDIDQYVYGNELK